MRLKELIVDKELNEGSSPSAEDQKYVSDWNSELKASGRYWSKWKRSSPIHQIRTTLVKKRRKKSCTVNTKAELMEAEVSPPPRFQSVVSLQRRWQPDGVHSMSSPLTRLGYPCTHKSHFRVLFSRRKITTDFKQGEIRSWETVKDAEKNLLMSY